MAKSYKTVVLLLPLMVILSSWMPISQCSKKPVGMARKEDIPYIQCQVCEKLAHQLYQQVQAKQDEILPKKISEYQIIEMTENVCNLKKQEADWILKIDIVEQGDRLELVEQDSEGQCGSECKTIERACQEVMGYSDTDVAEYLYKAKPDVDSLVKYLCKDLTGACSKKPPKVPKASFSDSCLVLIILGVHEFRFFLGLIKNANGVVYFGVGWLPFNLFIIM
ncbi:OLC1v1037657C2 [Oldenlandia corymbosa var. corymbosa]|uniref:OLC1v1037657C2 n=1 Tax=Oldenlandia corymbosa var. corymbosa TaxID=529605 RepID=A0AAV1CXW2_OLDCO|nr:OLC1v1037657C2 [Oldenlandia corymbosa var. corymbosa]